MTLGAGRSRGNVVGRFRCVRYVCGECRGRRMTARTVATRRVSFVERSRPRVTGSARGAGDHALVGGTLVAGLAAGYRCGDRGMSGDIQGRVGDVRRADVEPTGIDVGRRVAT